MFELIYGAEQRQDRLIDCDLASVKENVDWLIGGDDDAEGSE